MYFIVGYYIFKYKKKKSVWKPDYLLSFNNVLVYKDFRDHKNDLEQEVKELVCTDFQ